MGIAVPHVVIIEKSPVDAFLTEDSFDLSHLPAQLLQDCLNSRDPIGLIGKESVKIYSLFFDELLGDFIDDVQKLLRLFQLSYSVDFTQIHIVFKLATLIILLYKGLPILQKQLEIHQQFSETILIQSLFLPKELLQVDLFTIYNIQKYDLQRADQMSTHSSISFGLEHTAVFVEQPYIILQTQMFYIFRVLVEEEWFVCRSMPCFLQQNFVDQMGHIELSFGSMKKMTASQLLILINKAIAVIATTFVSYQLIFELSNGGSSARFVSYTFSLLVSFYQERDLTLIIFELNCLVLVGWNAKDQQLFCLISQVFEREAIFECICYGLRISTGEDRLQWSTRQRRIQVMEVGSIVGEYVKYLIVLHFIIISELFFDNFGSNLSQAELFSIILSIQNLRFIYLLISKVVKQNEFRIFVILQLFLEQISMNLQMNSPSDNPLQSSSNFLIPVKFEEHTITPKLKQTQLVHAPHTTQKLTKKIKECRICLQSEEEQSRLLNPCKCTGSIEYAHVHCLIEWIKRRIEMNADLKARCEVCDIEFNYRLASERIFDCSKLKHHYHKQKRSLICFAVVYGTLLLFFLTMIVLSVLGRDNQTIFLHNMLASSGGATLIVSCMVIYLIVLVVLIILFISEYMIKQQIVIVDVEKYREPKSLIKNYKIYFRR